MAASKRTKTLKPSKRSPTPKAKRKNMVIRRNAAPRPAIPADVPAYYRNAAPRSAAAEKDTTLGDRLRDMGTSHVIAGITGGSLASVAGVIAVGQGWMSPKATAGIMLGAGVATTTAGYVWEADHVMVAGAGMAAAGTFSFANQLAIDAYEAAEKRNQEQSQLTQDEADRRALLEADRRQGIGSDHQAERSKPRLAVR